MIIFNTLKTKNFLRPFCLLRSKVAVFADGVVRSNSYSNDFLNRRLTTTSKTQDHNFLEWFRGFTDAEGSFLIGKDQGFKFRFKIELHIDDKEVLYFIQNTLGIGKVVFFKSKVSFVVYAQSELQVIIDILTESPLNSTKQLNFLAFKKAFELYINKDSQNKLKTYSEIDAISNSINSKKMDYTLAKSHKIHVTPYWLLGFVEGDGSFFIHKATKTLRFSINQKDNLALIEAMALFLNDLGRSQSLTCALHAGLVSERGPQAFKGVVSLAKRVNSFDHSTINYLHISREGYIANVLIPFFDSLI